MRVFSSILVLFFCSILTIHGQNKPDHETFMSPIKPPYFFAGNFGELRPSHFHSGLDFRTQGKTGLPVFAVKDGYISRIGISPTGYGNALYMNHPDGTTSVYGHLLKFIPKIQEYLKEKQYDRESFQINLILSSEKFCFKKGEIIAWSGNSGSSGGPHLHFEIRDTRSERVLNPLFYHLGITDNSAPRILALYAYPLSDNSNVGPERVKKRFEAVTVPGGYRLKNNAPIQLYGKIGFGIQAEDYFNGTGLKCGIYSAELWCDGKEIFGFKMDNFSLGDARFANIQADYQEHLQSNRWIERLYKLPGNSLDIYYPKKNSGILNLDDGKDHNFEIIVSDAFNNKAVLKFRSTNTKSRLPYRNLLYTKEFFYDKTNEFENGKIRIQIPKGALYENLKFDYKYAATPLGCYSELHQVHRKFVPLHIPYTLSIKCNNVPNNLTDKILIAIFDPSTGKKTAVGGHYSNGWVTVETYLLGDFTVAIDKTPPTISALSVKDKTRLTDPLKVQFHIQDELSGIKSYRGEIDGKWVLFEYDEKTGTVTYTFDKERMPFGRSHLLRLVVTDNKENRSEYKAIIYK